MTEIASVSKLQSKRTAVIEKVSKPQEVEKPSFEIEMEEVDHAFALVKEIRQRVEQTYDEISAKSS